MKLATELNAMATKSIMNRENKKFNEAIAVNKTLR